MARIDEAGAAPRSPEQWAEETFRAIGERALRGELKRDDHAAVISFLAGVFREAIAGAERRTEQWAMREAALVEAGIRREAEWLNEQQELTRSVTELHEALRLLAEQVTLSGNADARDFGWPAAMRATRAALAKAEPARQDSDRTPKDSPC